MKRQRTEGIDGFVLRRRAQAPLQVSAKSRPASGPTQGLVLRSSRNLAPSDELPPVSPEGHIDETQPVPGTRTSGLRRSDIDESLRAIDEEQAITAKPHTSRKITKRIFAVLFLAILGVGVYTGVNTLLRASQVVKGNLFDVFQNKTLAQDQYGRTNILIFGTSEDDPAHIAENSGAELTDSIMVMSVDQKAKTAAMFSIPRDLWVKYGDACLAGYEGKINAAYECGKARSGSVEQGAQKLQSIVSKDFGIELQYYVKVGYTALKDAVNAVGGVSVKIESSDPRGIYDPNFDWQCAYRCKMVKWPNGSAQLDGEHALALARSRNAAGGYGLAGGNFDREQYQQKIILALRQKAISAGTLANPIAVNNLINTIGDNVKTNFETAEINTLVQLAKDIKQEGIARISLIEEGNSVVMNSKVGGASAVVPSAGTYDFSDVQEFIDKKLHATTTSSAPAGTVDVLNGSDVAGVASNMVTKLAGEGVVATAGDTETQASFRAVQWYDLSKGAHNETRQKLASVLGVQSSGTQLPSGVQSTADFVIILGNGSD